MGVVIRDWWILGQSGLDLPSLWRAEASVGRVMMLTGSGLARDEAFAAGADDYLAKPFVAAALAQQLEATLAASPKRAQGTARRKGS